MARNVSALICATAPMLMALAAPGCGFAKPVPPTLAQLAAFPKLTDFAVSSDGKHLIGLEAKGEDRQIDVWSTDNLAARPVIIASSKMKITGARFLKDDVLEVYLWQPIDTSVPTVDYRGDIGTHIFLPKLMLVDLDGRNWREPLSFPPPRSDEEAHEQAVYSPSIVTRMPNDRDHIIVINNIGREAGDVYRVNVRTMQSERIQRSDTKTSNYGADFDGNIRTRLKADTDSKGAYVITQMRSPGADWFDAFRSYVKDRDQSEIVGFTDDPNTALLLSNEGEDKSILYAYDVKNHRKTDVVFKFKYFESGNPILFPFKDSPVAKEGEVVGLSFNGPYGDRRDILWVNTYFKALDATIRDVLNVHPKPVDFIDPQTGEKSSLDYDVDQKYRIASYSRDMTSVVIEVDGYGRPPEWYLLHDKHLTLLAKEHADIDAASLGTMAFSYYTARDGQVIPAILTKPSADLCGTGPWPAVVLPHGGPWARDDLGWDAYWNPMLSTRCYAVLQPQYRGSEGWGRKLWKGGDHEWGGKMQDDKDDGAQWLIDHGIAIKGRIAMFGFSYGGYAAMDAAVRPNGYYKCAISGAGVSAIDRLRGDALDNPFFRDAAKPFLTGVDPLNYADKIKIPILVYHGKRDHRVPIEQSRWYVEKARKSDQKVDYVELEDFGHGQAWTRAIWEAQLHLIDDYLHHGCGGAGL